MRREDPEVRYHWLKTSSIVIAFFCLYEFGVLLWGFFAGFQVVIWFLLFGGFLLLGLCYSLQVTVYKNSLYLSWGVGLFTKEYSFSDFASFKIIPNKTLSAFLFNPKAELLLEVKLRSGKSIYLPADKPKKLADILKAPL